MRIIKAKDYAEMSRKAANIIAAQVVAKPNCVLGLATGGTPVGTYKSLIEDWYKVGDLSFAEVTTVNLDEYRGLPRTNDQSYWYFMHENLFDHIDIPAENINILNGMAEDLEAECQRYEDKIASYGGIDLFLGGSGVDGHIAFNEPADHFPVNTHCVDLTEETIEANKRFFASKDDVPRQAYTMGVGTIMNARKVLLIASGKDKAEIIKKSFFGPVTPEVPASILQMHPNVVLVGDQEALSLL